jgi:ABC-2 type transport system permease protein
LRRRGVPIPTASTATGSTAPTRPGIGALLRNQVAAIVASLVYLYVIEPIVAGIGVLQGAYKWLPGGAARAITTSFQAPELLQPWQGGLLLLGYGLLAAVLGTFLAVRRDIV